MCQPNPNHVGTGTDTDEASDINLILPGLYRQLEVASVALDAVKNTSGMNFGAKAAKAEQALQEFRHLSKQIIVAVHVVSNDVSRLKAQLELFQKVGFGNG